MIKNMWFSNFHSFGVQDEDSKNGRVDFEVSKRFSDSSYVKQLDDGTNINKVVAIVGSNGSGKTQLIKPFSFLNWFLCASFSEMEKETLLPFDQHSLEAKEDETKIGIEFCCNGEDYKYYVEMNPKRVSKEALYRKTSSSFSYVFVRELVHSGDKYIYEYKQKGFGLSTDVALKTRQNVSIVSQAAQHDVELAHELTSYFRQILSNITQIGRQSYSDLRLIDAAKFFFDTPELALKMKELLCAFDLGLKDIVIREEDRFDEQSGKRDKIYIPFGVHETSQGSFELLFFDESSGTRSAFVLAQKLVVILAFGGMAVIDEIDNDLHPHLLPVILDYFKSNEKNPFGAQLIFTCHTPEVLNLLNKYQLYLVEKEDGFSHSWRLDGVQGLRADDNAYAKYMAGALGAIPDV